MPPAGRNGPGSGPSGRFAGAMPALPSAPGRHDRCHRSNSPRGARGWRLGERHRRRGERFGGLTGRERQRRLPHLARQGTSRDRRQRKQRGQQPRHPDQPSPHAGAPGHNSTGRESSLRRWRRHDRGSRRSAVAIRRSQLDGPGTTPPHGAWLIPSASLPGQGRFKPCSGEQAQWPRRELNPHGDCSPQDFKSRASAYFATRPGGSAIVAAGTGSGQSASPLH